MMSETCKCGKSADVILNQVSYCRWHYEQYRDRVGPRDTVEVVGQLLDSDTDK